MTHSPPDPTRAAGTLASAATQTAESPAAAPPIVLVTGPSGAGRATAIRSLEDLGFEAIDNLPLSLIPRLRDGPPRAARLALGVDTRNRDFSVAALLELLDTPAAPGFELLYLDCAQDVLVRRFSETRRRHPMAPAEAPLAGIEREFDLLHPIRARAHVLVDTTDLNQHELRAEMARFYGGPSEHRLAVSVQSFSYKRGLPRGMDMVFDCRFLRNPYWDAALRDGDGRNPDVAEFIAEDPRFFAFFEKISDLTNLLLPAYVEEGKSHLAIAFGCTGGRHRSVATAERLVNTLASAGWQVSIRHRELERLDPRPPSASAPGVQGGTDEAAQAEGSIVRTRENGV